MLWAGAGGLGGWGAGAGGLGLGGMKVLNISVDWGLRNASSSLE